MPKMFALMEYISYFNNMLRSSRISKEQSLFEGVTPPIGDNKLRDFTDDKSWYNVFY